MKERWFWEKVEIGGVDDCWPWRLGTDEKGYGRIKLPRTRTTARAHRVAYRLATGVDPGDFLVCHSCDNPPCCNPRHLWLGDNGDNQWDAGRKGRCDLQRRRPTGEKNRAAKLTDSQVQCIFGLIAGGVPNTEIAEIYGVTHQAISSIRRGKSWRLQAMLR